MDQSAHNAFEWNFDLCAIYFSDKFIRLAMIADLFMINNDAILRCAHHTARIPFGLGCVAER